MASAQIGDVIDALTPGETITYVELLERMRAAGKPTDGVGVVLDRFKFAKGGSIANGVICAWQEPYFDFDHYGGWAEGTLHVSRKPDRAAALPAVDAPPEPTT